LSETIASPIAPELSRILSVIVYRCVKRSSFAGKLVLPDRIELSGD
jgi:hypothetical protein